MEFEGLKGENLKFHTHPGEDSFVLSTVCCPFNVLLCPFIWVADKQFPKIRKSYYFSSNGELHSRPQKNLHSLSRRIEWNGSRSCRSSIYRLYQKIQCFWKLLISLSALRPPSGRSHEGALKGYKSLSGRPFIRTLIPKTY